MTALDITELPFASVLEDCSGGNLKTPQSQFLPQGVYPIVDQGKELVAGYTNDNNALWKGSPPVIIFGDHTRALKFVDFPFCMGADGTKVLRGKSGIDTKFIFRYLEYIDVPTAGYDRHFKYLKRITFHVPPIERQRRIAAILDQADSLRNKRRQAISILESFLQYVFEEMFFRNDKWDSFAIRSLGDVQGGLQITPRREALPRKAPYLRVANVYRDRMNLELLKQIGLTDAEFTRVRLRTNDVLVVEGHGNPNEIGRSAVWDGSIAECVHQNHLIRIRMDTQQVSPVFTSAFLNSTIGRRQLIQAANTTSGLNTISVSTVGSVKLIVPPISRQREFEAQSRATRASMAVLSQGSGKLDQLFASLQTQAFNGEL